MKTRAGKLFPLALLVGMGLLTSWLDVLTQWQQPAQRELNPNQPEYTIEQLTAKRFDEQGRPWQQLVATRMWKLPKVESVYFTAPDLKQYQQGAPDLHITADSGRYNRPQDIADFSGNVHLLRTGQAGKPDMTLQTQALRLDNRNQLASSHTEVLMNYGNSRVRSVGLIYNHQAGQLKLLSQVRMHYAP
ncbi:LPS export ABC transporter periplasmic protein LptC [Vogesella sp. LIG4]|uniref:LPS export ABC transporter periplasmic protein LptC n=1 Tax=Vogesella sp. LIG4 TaxID=1192162 RepID=UPI00082007C2|nr:LPS export ABC transporter periplasmic protein LptC [Vogesella sp. LIG4]SCK17831.1 lipopolysaccharide export system protein LptC [Vogesella sp. LIG4]